jgi:hypothetical protein
MTVDVALTAVSKPKTKKKTKTKTKKTTTTTTTVVFRVLLQDFKQNKTNKK